MRAEGSRITVIWGFLQWSGLYLQSLVGETISVLGLSLRDPLTTSLEVTSLRDEEALLGSMLLPLPELCEGGPEALLTQCTGLTCQPGWGP